MRINLLAISESYDTAFSNLLSNSDDLSDSSDMYSSNGPILKCITVSKDMQNTRPHFIAYIEPSCVSAIFKQDESIPLTIVGSYFGKILFTGISASSNTLLAQPFMGNLKLSLDVKMMFLPFKRLSQFMNESIELILSKLTSDFIFRFCSRFNCVFMLNNNIVGGYLINIAQDAQYDLVVSCCSK